MRIEQDDGPCLKLLKPPDGHELIEVQLGQLDPQLSSARHNELLNSNEQGTLPVKEGIAP